MKKYLIVTVMMIVIMCANVMGSGIGIESIDTSQVDTVIEGYSNKSFGDMVVDVISGDFDIFDVIQNSITVSVKNLVDIGVNIIIICICSAFIQNLSESFKGSNIGKLGFYVCYITLTTSLINTFTITYKIAIEFLDKLNTYILAIIPVVTGTMVLGGDISSAYAYAPLFSVMSYMVINFFGGVLLNVIYMVAVIELVNYVTEKNILENFTNISKKFISKSLKVITIAYVGIVSTMKIGVPISDNIIKKSAKTAVNAVPVVGNVLSSAIDTASIVADATSSAVIVVAIVVCASMCIQYILRVFVYNIVFLVCSILVEPIVNEELAGSIYGLTTYVGYFISVMTVSSFLFIYSVVIMLI